MNSSENKQDLPTNHEDCNNENSFEIVLSCHCSLEDLEQEEEDISLVKSVLGNSFGEAVFDVLKEEIKEEPKSNILEDSENISCSNVDPKKNVFQGIDLSQKEVNNVNSEKTEAPPPSKKEKKDIRKKIAADIQKSFEARPAWARNNKSELDNRFKNCFNTLPNKRRVTHIEKNKINTGPSLNITKKKNTKIMDEERNRSFELEESSAPPPNEGSIGSYCRTPRILSDALGPTMDSAILQNISMISNLLKGESAGARKKIKALKEEEDMLSTKVVQLKHCVASLQKKKLELEKSMFLEKEEWDLKRKCFKEEEAKLKRSIEYSINSLKAAKEDEKCFKRLMNENLRKCQEEVKNTEARCNMLMAEEEEYRRRLEELCRCCVQEEQRLQDLMKQCGDCVCELETAEIKDREDQERRKCSVRKAQLVVYEEGLLLKALAVISVGWSVVTKPSVHQMQN